LMVVAPNVTLALRMASGPLAPALFRLMFSNPFRRASNKTYQVLAPSSSKQPIEFGLPFGTRQTPAKSHPFQPLVEIVPKRDVFWASSSRAHVVGELMPGHGPHHTVPRIMNLIAPIL
jgi:hypothetical protein